MTACAQIPCTDIGAWLKADFPLPWGDLSLRIADQPVVAAPLNCSLVVLTSRHLRLLFLTDGSTRPDLCLGSPIEPWRWWHVETVAEAIDTQPPPESPDPSTQLASLVDFVTTYHDALTSLLDRAQYRTNRATLREIEKRRGLQAAQRQGRPLIPEDPRRKWYSLRTLGLGRYGR